MEYSDKNSLDLIKALAKIFATDYHSIPIIMCICYREVPNSDLAHNNEKMIADIVTIANLTAKQNSEPHGLSRLTSFKKKPKQLSAIQKRLKGAPAKFKDIGQNFHLYSMAEDNLSAMIHSLNFLDEEVPSISKWLFEKTKGKMYWVSACLQNLFLGGYVEASMRGWRITKGKSLREVSIPNKMA